MKFSCCHNSTECQCLLGMAVLRILGDTFLLSFSQKIRIVHVFGLEFV